MSYEPYLQVRSLLELPAHYLWDPPFIDRAGVFGCIIFLVMSERGLELLAIQSCDPEFW